MRKERLTKVRQVNTFFWDDPYIQELYHFGKLLFLYLITSPHTNIAGSFEITEKTMHDHTGIPRTEITDLLKRFEDDKKIIYRNNWMLTVNTIEHQNINNSKILEGIKVILSMSPAWVIDNLCMSHPHLNLNTNTNNNEKKVGGPTVAAIAAVGISPSVSSDKNQESDPVHRRIWVDGKDLLTFSGMAVDQAGPLLGRWAKEHGRVRLAEAIAAAQAYNPPDPRDYIGGVLRRMKNGNPDLSVGRGSEPTREEEAAELAKYSCLTCFDYGTVLIHSNDVDSVGGMASVPCECGQPARSML